MYDELIERLRERAAWINFPHHGEEYPTEDAKLMMGAADAIEELMRRCEQFQYMPPPAWFPITTRPMTEEERKEWSEELGYEIEDDEALLYISQFPDDGQEVLVCGTNGWIWIDKYRGFAFEENGDMDGIVAWMPLPAPYNGERKDNADDR